MKAVLKTQIFNLKFLVASKYEFRVFQRVRFLFEHFTKCQIFKSKFLVWSDFVQSLFSSLTMLNSNLSQPQILSTTFSSLETCINPAYKIFVN